MMMMMMMNDDDDDNDQTAMITQLIFVCNFLFRFL